MPARGQRRRSSRSKTTRWIVAAIVIFSAMSCIAPVLYASDCSRWMAEYKQGILQRRAARRLRAAKYRLTAVIRPHPPVHHHPLRRPMGPLEALRRFQIDCGDLDLPEAPPRLPLLPFLPKPVTVEFPVEPPPTLPLPALTEVAQEVPPLAEVPTTTTPIEAVPPASPVPEPGSLFLVLTGGILGVVGAKGRIRRARGTATL